MSEPLSTRLRAQLAERQTHLDQLDDELSVQLKEIEGLLRNYLSVRVSVEFGAMRLAFGKINGAWCLQLISNGGVTITPLANCDRNLRARVLGGGHIEQLIRAGATQLETYITEREAALREAQHLLNLLKITP